MIRVELPIHLRAITRMSDEEISVAVPSPVTHCAVLDALEALHPPLRGLIRDYATQRRRPFLRFFACGEDLSLDPPDTLLPEAVADGREPFIVVAAIAGG